MGTRAQKAREIAAFYPSVSSTARATIVHLEGDERLSAAAKQRARAEYDKTITTLYEDTRKRLAEEQRLATDALERARAAGIAQRLTDPVKYEAVQRQAAASGGLKLRRLIRAAADAGDPGLVEAIRDGMASRAAQDGDTEALVELARIGTTAREEPLADLLAVQHIAARFEVAGPFLDAAPMLKDPVKAMQIADAAKVVPDEMGEPVGLPDAEAHRLLQIAGIEFKELTIPNSKPAT